MAPLTCVSRSKSQGSRLRELVLINDDIEEVVYLTVPPPAK